LTTTTGDANANIGDSGALNGPNRGLSYATNGVSLEGLVSDSTTLAPGSNSTGVFVGATVGSSFAEANGYFTATALRNGTNNGNANVSIFGGVSALNGVSMSGSVGQYNSQSFGLVISNFAESTNAVEAAFAEASGSANGTASRNDGGAGNATTSVDLLVTGVNQIAMLGYVGPEGSNNTGIKIDGTVTAHDASSTGFGSATASRTGTGAGGGNASATLTLNVQAANSITIGAEVKDYNGSSYGIAILGDVTASNASAFAEGNASTSTGNPSGSGPSGTQTSTANATAGATNTIAITGIVGSYVTNSYGVDPNSVSASNIVGPGMNAVANAFASATGPEGGTANATATALSLNDIGMTGTVGDHTTGSTGILVLNGVSATGAAAEGSAGVSVDNQGYFQTLTGSATVTAVARNKIEIGGGVGNYSDSDYGVNIRGDVTAGDVKIGVVVTTQSAGGSGATATATGSGLVENIVNLTGSVGNHSSSSNGVFVGGSVQFNGGLSALTSITTSGNYSYLTLTEGFNRAHITGQVGTSSPNSHGVQIGGDVVVTNALVSNFVIAGSDGTNDGTTRGVYIGGSVLTGDALDSTIQSGASSNNLPTPIVPQPTQVGDYVELAGSVFIGAKGGANSYGVDVAGGNDTVLVRDTHFQMDVVNGFNGGSNPDRDGQDVITFNNAQMYVSKLDNFERFNVTNQSFVILSNEGLYEVKDYSPSNMTAQINIDGHSVLSFGDGGTTPPVPEVSIPVSSLTLNTEILTIGGVNGVKSGVPDDSILKAENNGSGNYVINAVVQVFDDPNSPGTVYNFGTITLSKVLSAVRGTDPHGIFYNSSTSFDSPSEQLYWAVHGSWAIDPTSGAGDVLTINGNYVAGSDVIVDAYVFKTGSASDTLVINGNVGGITTVWVNNTNVTGKGALTGRNPTDGILLVDVNNNTQTPGDVSGKFVLGNTSGWNWADPVHFPIHEMQVGAFVYTLQQGGTDGKDFYLQSQLLDQVPGYTAGATAIQQHWYAELGTLYQRLGELRHGDVPPRDASKLEFWMRGVGEKNSISPAQGFDFDQRTYGFMIGGDYLWRNSIGRNSRLHVGGFFGYGRTKVDNISGTSGDATVKTNGWTVGGYATYFDTSRKGEGLYADAVLKVNFLNTDYSSSTRHTSAKNNDFAWGGSLEAGYGWGLGNGFIVQPQGQLTYMQVAGDKFDESSTPGIPLTIDRAAADSLRGRLGLQIQKTFTDGTTQFSPYLIGNVIHEFLGNNKTTVGGAAFRSDMGGTWYNVGGGLTADFGRVGLYGHVEYTFGGNVEGIGGGLGLKYRW
jgi:outer membrane autotransporter protein